MNAPADPVGHFVVGVNTHMPTVAQVKVLQANNRPVFTVAGQIDRCTRAGVLEDRPLRSVGIAVMHAL